MNDENILSAGTEGAPIVVVCDVPTGPEWERGTPMGGKKLGLFQSAVRPMGYGRDDFLFVSPCPPYPEGTKGRARAEGEWLMAHREAFVSFLRAQTPRLILGLGASAMRAVNGKACAITKARGSPVHSNEFRCGVLPMLSPGHVLRLPEMTDIFMTDALMVGAIEESGWRVADISGAALADTNYHWCTDLSFLLDEPPGAISVDTEGTGVDWYNPTTYSFMVQIGYKPGHVALVPLCPTYYGLTTKRKAANTKAQLRQIMENPNIKKTFHNGSYDIHMLRKQGINVEGWVHDTINLAFSVDDNMRTKSLSECTRRWLPHLAGYSDKFDAETDKSKMIEVPPEEMESYAGGDADASLQLASTLVALAKQDEKNYRCYKKVIMPATRAFTNHIERWGVRVDTDQLTTLYDELSAREQELYHQIIQDVPPAVKRRHADKGLTLSRSDFIRDILFSRDGLRLKAKVFTKSTASLPKDPTGYYRYGMTPEDRRKLNEFAQPSTSAKDHLPYFTEEPLVGLLTEYSKIQKMRGTYVGRESDPDNDGNPTGFWKYLDANKEIHPSYFLSGTATGRTASRNPNGQNIPSRGPLAKSFKRIFVARPGKVFLAADLSQAELRIAAWMANERNMIRIYQDDGDIHLATAAEVMGITTDQLLGMPREVVKQKRQQAKAINFGFLFGMWWKSFKTYAKTDYGVEFTDQEAQAARESFFGLYPGLETWHETMRAFVRRHGYVRALHGAIRRLPAIYSDDEAIVGAAERMAINSPVQRFASDVGLMALIQLTEHANPDLIRPVMFIHDALVCEVDENHQEEMACNLKWVMENPPLKKWFGLTPPLPIKSDVERGYNLADTEELEEVEAIRPIWLPR